MKLFAQIMALYFLLGSVLPGSDFSQLRKAPAAWEHFQYHQELARLKGQQKEASLWYFMAAHFWNPDSHDHQDGGESHKDLPLKSVHLFAQVPVSRIALDIHVPASSVQGPSCFYQPPASNRHEEAIFRPPIFS